MHSLCLAALAALALAASGCTAARRAAAGVQDSMKAGKKRLSRWQHLVRSHRKPAEKPWVYGDVRPGKGRLGKDEDGIVLYRQGEAQSPDPSKPTGPRRQRVLYAGAGGELFDREQDASHDDSEEGGGRGDFPGHETDQRRSRSLVGPAPPIPTPKRP